MNPVKIFILIAIIVLAGCSANNRFKTYYGDYGEDPSTFEKYDKDPKLIATFDIKGKVNFYENGGYIIIGTSSFDGEWEPRTKAIDFAKKIGASVIITQSKHTGNIANRYSISVPTTTTAQHTGTVRDNYGYGNSISYSGTTTIHSSERIHRSFTTGQYEQEAVFMAKGVSKNGSH